MNENSDYTDLEIAVIGMAGRFPGAKNIEEFWNNLKNGTESITFFLDEELRKTGVEEELLNHPDYVKAMGVLPGIEEFDADFFDYAPIEAEVLDPQVRLFHECAWEALEDAGYAPGSYKGLIGLYAGASDSFPWKSLTILTGKGKNLGGFESDQLSSRDYLCSRVAYKFDLKGPVVLVQTACSTSLAAIHLAYQGLLSGEADIALAGGVSVTPGKSGYLYQEGMILSPDGHCRAFDSKAKGTLQGDGVGIVVLKRLEEAVEDGDHIYAMVKGSAINNDGTQKIGFTAPSVRMQSEVLRDALRTAQVEADSIGYIEAHGTGTVLGDPVEFEALKKAYKTDKKGYCGIGSVKSNVGHLGCAAGVAGFIKAVLTLNRRVIPPSLHFEIPNKKLSLVDSPFYINTNLTEWQNETNQYPRRAAVSSLGVGGTNVHMILEEWQEGCRGEPPSSPENCDYHLIILSAKTESALEKMTENLVNDLKNPVNPVQLPDIAYTLQVGREAFKYRKMAVCKTADDAINALSSPGYESARAEGEPNAVFLFPAQGGQYVNMGRELYQTFSLFREETNRCGRILKPIIGYDIKEVLYPASVAKKPAGNSHRINSSEMALLTTFILEYALAKLLMKWGIKPRAMIGEGVGEYAAALLSTVFSLEDALKMLVFLGSKTEESKKYISKIPLNKPRIPYISSVTGNWITVEQALDHHYWVDSVQLKQNQSAGYFDGIKEVLKEENPVFVTLGLVNGSARPEGLDINLVNGIRKTDEEVSDLCFLWEKIGRLWLYGVNIRWEEFYPGQERRRVSLPAYPFERQRYWIEGDPFKMGLELLSRNSRINKKEDMAEWFYIPSWKRSPSLPLTNTGYEGRDRWMVFMDESGIGLQLAERLKGRNRKIITVIPGSEFTKTPGHEDTFTIDPGQSSDYVALFETLGETGKMPGKIIHLWGLDSQSSWNPSGDISKKSFDSIQYRGFYSLLFLAKAVNKQKSGGEIQVLVVTANAQDISGEDPLNPAAATIMGAVKVIPQEFPYITCRSIDIVLPQPGSQRKKKLVDQLVREFSFPSLDHAAAYRGNDRLTRWTQTYEPLRLRQVKGGIPKLRRRGVYVIFGGLGKIGFELAKYLATHVRARLILVGRSFIPEKRQRDHLLYMFGLASTPTDNDPVDPFIGKLLKIKQLEEMGGEVLTISADASHREEIERGIARSKEHFGHINGVFYAAGETRETITCGIEHLDEQGCKKQFQARVYGLLVLEKVLGDRELDFCLVVTSLVSVLGGLGFAAYAAAVIFMDAFVHYHNRKHPVPWMSVNTAEWLFGDAVDQNVGDAFGAETLELAMTPGQGIETFERILAHCSDSQVIVSTGDLQPRIDKWIKLETLRDYETAHRQQPVSRHPRPDLSNPYIPPSTPGEKVMVEAWQSFFRIEPIGIEDNFFELGGDSLKVIALVSRMRREFNVKISIEEFFDKVAIKDIAGHIGYIENEDIKSEDEEGDIERYKSIEPIEKKDYYPMSSAQKRLYLIQQFFGGSQGMGLSTIAYNISYVLPVGTDIEKDRVESMLKKLIARHESLRTSFDIVNEMPVQRVHDSVAFKVDDYSMEGTMEEIAVDFVKPFDLTCPPLLRSAIIKLPNENHIWIVDLHHIISDGKSQEIIIRDYLSLFNDNELEPLRLQYKDFSEWHNHLLAEGEIKVEENYWESLFTCGNPGEIPRLQLPTDFKRPEVFTFTGSHYDFVIEREDREGFRALASRNKGTLNMNILSALCTLFYKYTGQEDIIIGNGIEGRPHEDLQQISGMFVNILPLRCYPGGEKTYESFLREVIAHKVKALENQDVRFEELVERLDLERDPSRNPIFDICVLQPQSQSESGFQNIYQNPTSRFDATFFIRDSGENIQIDIEYYTGIFREETIKRLVDHFKNIIRAVIKEPSVKLKDIEIISEV